MVESPQARVGGTFSVERADPGQPDQGQAKQHVYDSVRTPERFRGVIRRRIIAFVIDASIIIAITLFSWFLLLLAGILTFGLAWLLMGAVFPVVALGYIAWTVSGPDSATIGMRAVELEMRTWYGDRMYALLGAFHALLFWFSVSLLTPLVLLVPFFDSKKRCLHDMLSGVLVINNEHRTRHF